MSREHSSHFDFYSAFTPFFSGIWRVVTGESIISSRRVLVRTGISVRHSSFVGRSGWIRESGETGSDSVRRSPGKWGRGKQRRETGIQLNYAKNVQLVHVHPTKLQIKVPKRRGPGTEKTAACPSPRPPLDLQQRSLPHKWHKSHSTLSSLTVHFPFVR